MQATVLHWAGAAAGVLLSMVRSKLQSINDVRLASPCSSCRAGAVVHAATCVAQHIAQSCVDGNKA